MLLIKKLELDVDDMFIQKKLAIRRSQRIIDKKFLIILCITVFECANSVIETRREGLVNENVQGICLGKLQTFTYCF